MDAKNRLEAVFSADRTRLQQVAFRMLGSATAADDAVQETWLRASRSGIEGVDNVSGWLTTVIARVCLDQLRVLKAHPEEAFDLPTTDAHLMDERSPEFEREVELAESVGNALMVVLQTLPAAERVAFVLHDAFAMPFDDIARLLDRSSESARQLATRARKRIRGNVPDETIRGQQEVVKAFMAASRAGDFDGLLALLHPDVVLHAGVETVGARNVIKSALSYNSRSRFSELVLIDGLPGIVAAPGGRLAVAMQFRTVGGRIVEITISLRPEQLRALEVAVL